MNDSPGGKPGHDPEGRAPRGPPEEPAVAGWFRAPYFPPRRQTCYGDGERVAFAPFSAELGALHTRQSNRYKVTGGYV